LERTETGLAEVLAETERMMLALVTDAASLMAREALSLDSAALGGFEVKLLSPGKSSEAVVRMMAQCGWSSCGSIREDSFD
jgi:hypothetical protein